MNIEEMSFDNVGFFLDDAGARTEWQSGNQKSGRGETQCCLGGWGRVAPDSHRPKVHCCFQRRLEKLHFDSSKMKRSVEEKRKRRTREILSFIGAFRKHNFVENSEESVQLCFAIYIP